MNFSGFTSNTLTFKVAYARYSATYFDSLIVWATTDCGNTWTRVYNKGNTTLATNGGANLTTTFVPNANQWRLETVDLSQFAGQSNVRLNFQNKSGYGNFIYIDEINITGSTSTAPPTSSFNTSTTSPCAGQTVSFTNTSTGATSYSWTFPGGTPSTSNSPNPTVVYNSPGTYTVTLTSTNAFGSQNSTESITVGALPATPTASSNSPTQINGSLNLFANGSTGNYFWTGPNGFTSNDQNPQINNPGTSAGGQYCVYVVASGCTSQTACTQVVVSGYVSVNNAEAFDVAIFPNPTKDVVNIHKGDNAAVRVKLTDMTGKTVIQETEYSDAQFSINLGDFARGVYFLSLENEKGTVIRKIVKQ